MQVNLTHNVVIAGQPHAAGDQVEVSEELARELVQNDLGTAAAAEQPEQPAGPSKDWKLDDLKGYATERGLDVAEARTKQEVLDALAAAEQPEG